MNQYFLESHRNGVPVSQNDIAETVADEDDVDTGFVNNTGGRVIVRCQTYEPFTALFAGFQRRCTDLFGPFWFQIGHLSALFTPRFVDNWIASETRSLEILRAY